MDKDALRQRNIELFKTRFADVWDFLSVVGEPTTRIFEVDGQPCNIGISDEQTIYEKDAVSETSQQIEAYFADPDRLGFADATHLNLSAVSEAALKTLLALIDDKTKAAMPTYPVTDVGWCFILGLGLGYHLPPLVERTRAHTIVIIEPIYEFILHSLSSIDWVGLVEDADAHDQTIVFVLEDNPRQAVRLVQKLFNNIGVTFFDGSYAYTHYPSWALQKCRQILNEKTAIYGNSTGFFEDEVIMLSNAYLNLTVRETHLVQIETRLERTTPVFLVASGPSLDEALPVIKEWQDRAVIISCGTALGVLLKHKIRPHLHIENENTYPLVRNLQSWRDAYGLEGIRLAASTTVSPEAPKLFDSAWFFFREPLSATRLLSTPGKAFNSAAPLVANAGFVIAATLGFSKIYLFGVDCGRKIGGEHHARDVVYYDEDYDQWRPGTNLARLETDFDRRVPGNFGGEVETNYLYDASRENLVSAQRSFQVQLINCSDGAQIDGAVPCHPDALDLSAVEPGLDQDKLLGDIEKNLTLFDAETCARAFDFGAYNKMCDRFEELLDIELEEARETDRGFWDFEQRFRRFRVEKYLQIQAPWALIAPSASTIVRLGAFVGSRIADESQRAAFFHEFIGVFHERMLHMNERARTLFKEMAGGAIIPAVAKIPGNQATG